MSLTPPITNFDRAEFPSNAPRPDHCVLCNRAITTEYYRVDGKMACPGCAQRTQSLLPPDSHSAYSRAVLFGVAASVAGCIGYSLFTILSGITLGWAAIAVGWLVGKAMHTGSRGVGGKRYQWTAAALTYAAVAVSFVPIALHERGVTAKRPAATNTVASPAPGLTPSTPLQTQGVPAPQNSTSVQLPYPGDAAKKSSPSSTLATETPAPAPPISAMVAPRPAASPKRPAPSFGRFVAACCLLLGLGLVSPLLILFSSPVAGLISAVILFLGLSTAWRLTARKSSEVDGPFQMTGTQQTSILP